MGKKSKKHIHPILAIVAVKLLALAPIVFGKLVLLVGKAVFFAKIAFLIAGVLAYQRFFGAGAQGAPGAVFGGNFFGRNPAYNAYADGSAYAPVAQPEGYYKRSFGEEAKAQQLAYSAQVPTFNTAETN